MYDPKDKYLIHLIDVSTDKVIARPIMRTVPRIGDEIRRNDTCVLEVTMVVWCLDEPESLYNRVNLGVKNAINI